MIGLLSWANTKIFVSYHAVSTVAYQKFHCPVVSPNYARLGYAFDETAA